MEKFHKEHARHLAETMLSDAREMEYSSLADEMTYGKVDTNGWQLEWKEPSIKVYESKGTPCLVMIIVESRKRKYIRRQDYRR